LADIATDSSTDAGSADADGYSTAKDKSDAESLAGFTCDSSTDTGTAETHAIQAETNLGFSGESTCLSMIFG
jgi:hypothetical protein